MNELQLLEVMHMKTITDPLTGKKNLFSVPITCPLSAEEHERLQNAERIVLKCSEVSSDPLAVISKPQFFVNRKEEICARTFGTLSAKHCKAERIMAEGNWLLSGETKFVKKIVYNDGLDAWRLTPSQIQEQVKAKGADAVYAFQVRNPLHNGHVLLLKDTRE